MAVAKFGGIVTEIAGSVGGSTFRRSRNGVQVYNKSSGRSRSSGLTNPKLSVIQGIIQDWSGLSQINRDEWNTQGGRFERENKFGESVNYTGRELYISVRSAIQGTGISLPVPANVSSLVDMPILTSVEVVSNEYFEINVSNPDSGGYICLQVQLARTEASGPVYKRYKTLGKLEMSAETTYDFRIYVSDLGWFNTVGCVIFAWVYYINDSGWRSAPVVMRTTVTGS